MVISQLILTRLETISNQLEGNVKFIMRYPKSLNRVGEKLNYNIFYEKVCFSIGISFVFCYFL